MKNGNWQGFVMGFVTAAVLVSSLGAALVGESAEDRYLKACVALQGEQVFMTGRSRLTDEEKNNRDARADYWFEVMKQYKP